jgi:hypothetical protein
MSPHAITSPTDQTKTSLATNRGEVPLRGKRLRILQGLWVILVLCDLLVLVVSLPVFYQALHTDCSGPVASCESDQLNPQALVGLQHAGITLHAYALYVFSWDMLTTLAFLIVGIVIIWRRSNTFMGLFVSFLLISFGTLGLSAEHVSALRVASQDSLLIFLATIVGNPLSILAYLCLGCFFFIFPDGNFVPRWSWALISLWIMNFVFWLAPANSPININNWPLLLGAVWLFVVFGGSLATQVYRYRRVASPLQRQQIKWLIFGFVPVLVIPVLAGLIVTLFPALNSPGSLLVIVIEPLWRFYYLPIPLCIGIALLRYRLWDIDVVINRTLVYGTLTASLAVVYFGLIFALQYMLRGIISQNNNVAIVISTLAIAALFKPLRHRIQNVIDRRFYRRKYDAAQIVESFSITLRNEVDLGQLRENLLTVVQETMQPAHVSLWLLESNGKTSPLFESLRASLEESKVLE